MNSRRSRLEDTEITLENHTTFYAIAYRQHEEVKRLAEERDRRPVKTDADADFNAEMNSRIQRSAMVVVVFSALTLEAFINHYGIERFSAGFFDDHLDRLGPVSKWVVIPRLTVGRELDRGGESFTLLTQLFRLRNKLVHYKMRKKKIRDLREEEDWVTEMHAEEAVRAVEAAIRDLKAIDASVDAEWLATAKTDPYA